MDDKEIKLDDELMKLVGMFSGGNSISKKALIELIKVDDRIIPDNEFRVFNLEEYGVLLMLEPCGILDDNIEIFYKDVCGEDATKMLACIRSIELRLIRARDLRQAIENKDSSFSKGMIEKVRKKLPDFAPNYKAFSVKEIFETPKKTISSEDRKVIPVKPTLKVVKKQRKKSGNSKKFEF